VRSGERKEEAGRNEEMLFSAGERAMKHVCNTLYVDLI